MVIRASGVGKKYLIGHQVQRVGDQSFREVVGAQARNLWRRAGDLARGRAIVIGDSVEEIHALRDVSFEVAQGEVVGLIGRNGAGKSTLLKVLSRITEPSSGRIAIRGRVASLLEVGTGFHPELTGRENVFLNGSILGMSRTEVKARFDSIVEFAGVEKFIDTPVKRYSTGMYVRLGFSVAAHLQTEILIVDEVLAVGDLEFQRRCLGKMDEAAQSGRTVLFVSHSMPMIASLCRRALLMHEGQLLADGPPSDVIHSYQSGPSASSASVAYENERTRPGDDDVRLLAGAVTDKRGETQLEHSLFDPVRVEMKFRVLADLPRAPQPSFHFFESGGACVFVSTPHDWDADAPIKAGDYVATCEVPAHLLNDGMYSVSLGLNTMHNRLQTAFFERHALTFSIVDPIEQNPQRELIGWGGRIPGVVRPRLHWSLEAAR